MINTYKYSGETWVDIDHGTPEEIHRIMDTYSIHPFVAKELTSVTPKPRVEFHDHYIYCILHFPVFKHTHLSGKSQEVDFIIGQDVLITAKYDTIDALHKFAKDLQTREILDKGDHTPQHSNILFIKMLQELYASLFEELAYIEDLTEEITSKIFKGKEREMVVSISEVIRTLLDFKRVTDLHHEILETLNRKGTEIFGETFGHKMEAVIADYLKINTAIKSNLEVLHELQDTNTSLVTTNQNEAIKKFTIIGAILIFLSIVVTVALLL